MELVGIDEVFYASSHGLRIVGPQGSNLECDQGKPFKYLMDIIYRELGLFLTEIPGIVLEHGVYTVAVHYRLVSECNALKVYKRIRSLIEHFPDLRLTHGKKVYEIRPRLDWDKGTAVEWILSCLERKLVPIYVGDDVTDEDAFLRIRERGFGILVSEDSRRTHAKYSLRNSYEVRKFLKELYEIDLCRF
jgi:trehalose-phosphatase